MIIKDFFFLFLGLILLFIIGSITLMIVLAWILLLMISWLFTLLHSIKDKSFFWGLIFFMTVWTVIVMVSWLWVGPQRWLKKSRRKRWLT
tara:strand:+ start:144 stop:413 length:270 start_codon:yes stop_codon:yes gene_type:complete